MASESIDWLGVIAIWIALGALLLRDRIGRALRRWRRPTAVLLPGDRAYWLWPSGRGARARSVVVVEALPGVLGYYYVVSSGDRGLRVVDGKDLVPDTSNVSERP